MSSGAAPAGVEALAYDHLHELLRQLLDEGLDVELGVTGGSMSPFVRCGDLLTLSPRRGRPIRSGDVVAFLAGGRWLVIHRVVSTEGDHVHTRGDALRRSDAPVPLTEVVAVISAIDRRGRRVGLGLGPERVLLAWLSRLGWLAPLARPWRWLARRTS